VNQFEALSQFSAGVGRLSEFLDRMREEQYGPVLEDSSADGSLNAQRPSLLAAPQNATAGAQRLRPTAEMPGISVEVCMILSDTSPEVLQCDRLAVTALAVSAVNICGSRSSTSVSNVEQLWQCSRRCNHLLYTSLALLSLTTTTAHCYRITYQCNPTNATGVSRGLLVSTRCYSSYTRGRACTSTRCII
jgi:hypothetical protein